MEIKILKSEEINKEIGETFIDLVNAKPNAVIGLATGSSPIGVYEYLTKAYNEKRVSFKDVVSFNLDEYVGLDGNDDQSYRYFMNYHLFNNIDIHKLHTNVPSGKGFIRLKARQYDKKIAKAGGIDLQILGLGSDCHIAFNEPGTPLNSLTHVTKIAESTIKDNARFFDSIDDVPTKAVTMGLQSIMNTRKIVLVATGKNKAQAVKDMVEGEISPKYPGSVLRNHPDCTIYIDKDAASLLSKK